jgi:voltage-gated potassium channel
MYWGIVALTTTGYGDVTPITDIGKFLAGITAIIGVGVIALPVGILASGFVTELELRAKRPACPHCGKEMPAR